MPMCSFHLAFLSWWCERSWLISSRGSSTVWKPRPRRSMGKYRPDLRTPPWGARCTALGRPDEDQWAHWGWCRPPSSDQTLVPGASMDHRLGSPPGDQAMQNNYYSGSLEVLVPHLITTFTATWDMPTRCMPTRYMPTRYMPTRYMSTRYMPTRYMPTRYLPTRYLPTR